MKLSLTRVLNQKIILPFVMGLSVSLLVLILTLNLVAAIAVFALVAALLVFGQSISKGWLFLLSFILLFPTVKVGSSSLFLYDMLLVVLSLVGISIVALKNIRGQLRNNLFFGFSVLLLLSAGIAAKDLIMKESADREMWTIGLSFVWFYVSLIVFQYLFLSYKRLRLFFAAIMMIGALHSTFGLVMYLGGWQTSSGMGISTGKISHVIFHEPRYQINGFFGNGMEKKVGENILSSFLLISIPITLGFYLDKKRKKSPGEIHSNRNLLNLLRGDENLLRKSREFKIFDIRPAIFENVGKSIFSRYIDIVKNSREIIFLLIQGIALLLTFSYESFIFLNIGILLMGILLRNRNFTAAAAVTIILFALVLPGIRSFALDRNVFSGEAENSYLYIWEYYGVFGMIAFLALIGRYFYDAYGAYRKSDGSKRIWLIVIIAIFFELIFKALTSNVLLFGPAALVFWLLYGAVINLREKQVIFGIT